MFLFRLLWRAVVLLALLLSNVHPVYSQQPADSSAQATVTLAHDYPVTPVSSRDVYFPNEFYHGSHQIQQYAWHDFIQFLPQIDAIHAIDHFGQSGVLRNFDRAAGKLTGNFEGQSRDDADVFMTLEGLSYASAYHKSDPYFKPIDGMLNSLIAHVVPAQQTDGYLVTSRIVPGISGAGSSIDRSHFAPDTSGSELYSMGHLIEAGVAHYESTGERTMLESAIKAAELVCGTFGPGKRSDPPARAEIELALCRLYRVTGRSKYLETAKFMIDQRGNAAGHSLYGAMDQDTKPVKELTEAEGRPSAAVTLYAAIADVSALTGDKSYLPALERVWNSAMGRRMYVTGGLGIGETEAKFGSDFELPNEGSNCEISAAIGNVFWNQRMFQLTGDSKYLDVVELELMNGARVGRAFSKSEFYSKAPLQFNDYAPRSEWPQPGTSAADMLRFAGEVGGLFYAIRENELFVNQYGYSTADFKLDGELLNIMQEDFYPLDEDCHLTVKLPTGALSVPADTESVGAIFRMRPTPTPIQRSKQFTINLRIPGWLLGHAIPGDLYRYIDDTPQAWSVLVNGEDLHIYPNANGFVRITRKWTSGDQITLHFPMPLRRVIADARVKGDNGRMALKRGPEVYCLVSRGMKDRDALSRIVIEDKASLPSAGYLPLSESREQNTVGAKLAESELTSIDLPFRSIDGPSLVRYAEIEGFSDAMTLWISRDAQSAKPTRVASSETPGGRPGLEPTNSHNGFHFTKASASFMEGGELPRKQYVSSTTERDPHACYGEWTAKDAPCFVEFEMPPKGSMSMSQLNIVWRINEDSEPKFLPPLAFRVFARLGGKWRLIGQGQENAVSRMTRTVIPFRGSTDGLRIEVDPAPGARAGFFYPFSTEY